MMGVRWIVFTPKGKSRPKNRHPVSMKSWSALATWSKPESGPHCLYFSIRRSTIPLYRYPRAGHQHHPLQEPWPLWNRWCLCESGTEGVWWQPHDLTPFFRWKSRSTFCCLTSNCCGQNAICLSDLQVQFSWLNSMLGSLKFTFFGLQVQLSSLKFPFCGLNMIKLHSSVAPSCGGAFWLAVQTPFFLREFLQGSMVSQSFVEISICYHHKMYMRPFM